MHRNDDERLADLEREMTREDPVLGPMLTRGGPEGAIAVPVVALVAGFLALAWLLEWSIIVSVIAMGIAAAAYVVRWLCQE